MPTGATLPIHLDGVREVKVATYNSMPNYWRDITGEPMTTKFVAERMALMTGLATAERVNEGGGVQFDEITTPYDQTFYTDLYAVGVEFTDKQLATDTKGKLRRIGTEFGKSLNYAREILVAGLINNGTDTAFPWMNSGLALFSASQPSSTGVWSNLSTAAALDITALEQMLVDRKSHKTLKGQKWLSMGPVRLITGEALELTSKRLLISTGQPGTPDNDLSAIKQMGSIQWARGNQLLTDTNAYTMVPIGDANPLFLLVETGITDEVQEDKDIRTQKKLMVAAMDETVGALYPAGLQHNVGA